MNTDHIKGFEPLAYGVPRELLSRRSTAFALVNSRTDLPDSQGGQGSQSSKQGRRNSVDKPPRHNDLLLDGGTRGDRRGRVVNLETARRLST